jgi:uncharacterized membrane protein
MPVALRSLALLCATGASVALFLQEILGAWLGPFISANVLSLPNRQRLLIGMIAGVLAGAVVGLLAWGAGVARLRRLAHLLAPGILLALLPPLFLKSAWPSPLNIGLVIAAFLLLSERLYRIAFAAAAEGRAPSDFPDAAGSSGAPSAYGRLRHLGASLWRGLGSIPGLLPVTVRRWLPAAVVGAGALGYAIYMSVFTLRMHGRFQTYGYDLGQYDNVFWSTLHGHPLRDGPLSLTKDWQELGDHALLSVFFFLPFYALKPGGAILLVIQSCVLGLGAIPLYRFAARRLSRSFAALIALAYLFYPPMHGLQFYDFHMQPIAATFVLFVIDFVDERRYWLCAIAFVIAIGCREDIPIGLALLGAFLALSGHRFRAGLIMAVTGSAYFVLMRFVVMPSFGGGWFQSIYKDLVPQGAPNFGGVIATLFSNPIFAFVSLLQAEKLRYALQILLPLAFLPLRRSYLVLSIVPGSLFTLLTTQYAPTIDTGFQYSAHFIPYVFPAVVLAIAAYGAEGEGLARRRAALAAVVTGTVLCGVFWGAIPPRDSIHGGFGMLSMAAPSAADRQKEKDLRALHAMIPPTASVAVSEAEMPHISRLEMRSLRDTTDADYILFANGSAGSANGERVLATREFEKIADRPGLMLLKRKAKAPTQHRAPPPGPGTPSPLPVRAP